MRLQTAFVDLSGLPGWPHYFKACADMHRQLDPFYTMRQQMGAAVVRPARYEVLSLGERLLLIARKVDGLAG